MSDPRLDADPLLSLGPAAFTTFRGMAIQCGVNWSISNKATATTAASLSLREVGINDTCFPIKRVGQYYDNEREATIPRA
jgi:hypothetical protein